MGKATENLARVTPIWLDLAKTVFQFAASARKASLPSLASFSPLAAQIDALDHGIATIDDKLIETVKGDKEARRLMTIPGVGR